MSSEAAGEPVGCKQMSGTCPASLLHTAWMGGELDHDALSSEEEAQLVKRLNLDASLSLSFLPPSLSSDLCSLCRPP